MSILSHLPLTNPILLAAPNLVLSCMMMTCTAVYSDARARVHAQIVHVLIVLLSLLCTCLLRTQIYSLATVIATLTCMRVST